MWKYLISNTGTDRLILQKQIFTCKLRNCVSNKRQLLNLKSYNSLANQVVQLVLDILYFLLGANSKCDFLSEIKKKFQIDLQIGVSFCLLVVTSKYNQSLIYFIF